MARTPKTQIEKYKCFHCNKEFDNKNFYKSFSTFFNDDGRIPYCKQCIEKFYQYYYDLYVNNGYLSPERKAVRRVCMALDVYFTDKAFKSAMDKINVKKMNISPMGAYMSVIQLSQHTRHEQTYDTTVAEEEKKDFMSGGISESSDVDDRVKEFFGYGFTDDDYKYLKKEYDDWTARHECNTKAQEEVFKRICFKQLEILKATRAGEDTKNLDATFQNLLDTAKLQPKQNKGDTVADNQTFGTLIDKWENTRPIDEPEDQFKDVDNIGLYIDVFYRGHLAKMMGLKNALSNLYTRFIEKFTVKKPEYSDDESSEILFDSIFGNASDMKD